MAFTLKLGTNQKNLHKESQSSQTCPAQVSHDRRHLRTAREHEIFRPVLSNGSESLGFMGTGKAVSLLTKTKREQVGIFEYET